MNLWTQQPVPMVWTLISSSTPPALLQGQFPIVWFLIILVSALLPSRLEVLFPVTPFSIVFPPDDVSEVSVTIVVSIDIHMHVSLLPFVILCFRLLAFVSLSHSAGHLSHSRLQFMFLMSLFISMYGLIARSLSLIINIGSCPPKSYSLQLLFHLYLNYINRLHM